MARKSKAKSKAKRKPKPEQELPFWDRPRLYGQVSYDYVGWLAIFRWVARMKRLIRKTSVQRAQFVARCGPKTIPLELERDGWEVIRGYRPTAEQIEAVMAIRMFDRE